MATITKGRTFTSGETVTPAKLNDVVDQATVTFSTAADTDDATLEISGNKFRVKDSGVTLAKLVAAVQNALVPAGAVQAFAMNSVPSGWLFANGSNVSRTTYAALFDAIGTTYGAGDGTTTFTLPDLRGYFVRGSGTNGDGTAAGTFGAKQADDLKAHTHVVGSRVNATAFGTGIVAASNSGTINGNDNSTQSTGGTETRPKNIAMLYCIKF